MFGHSIYRRYGTHFLKLSRKYLDERIFIEADTLRTLHSPNEKKGPSLLKVSVDITHSRHPIPIIPFIQFILHEYSTI